MTDKLKVLLIEPNYKNKYPPLGLMKLSAFHNDRNDTVHAFKGNESQFNKNPKVESDYDRIYISTVFTFQYRKTVESIKLARKHIKEEGKILLGGPGATMLKEQYIEEFEEDYQNGSFVVVDGLLNKTGKLGLPKDAYIDKRIPDYSILKEIDYEYPTNDSYIGYSTRGCPNNCKFCAVPKLEPKYNEYISLKKIVNGIENNYGEKRHLLLMDNNVLASDRFEDIINDIIDLGFEKGATDSEGRKKYVDFNQGLDARFLTEEKAKLLGKIAIRPARVAFDHVESEELYKEKIRLLAKNGVKDLSNFLLYNFKDKPEDLLKRILINIDLNEENGVRIFSFPMKYIPLDQTDRRHVGPNWKKKQLRAIQNILHATHGVVGPKRPFVQKAFCNIPRTRSEKESVPYEELKFGFLTLLWMPEEYIMYRETKKKKDATKWWNEFTSLNEKETELLINMIKDNAINFELYSKCENQNVKKILKHYKILLGRLKRKIDFGLQSG